MSFKDFLNSKFGKHFPSLKMINMSRITDYTCSRTGTDTESAAPEEWIWVEGYKGTDKDMVCRDTQFELGKRYDMPEDAKIAACSCGYHFCQELKPVFGYYAIKDGNRFFKVRGLVRKSDYEEATKDVSDLSILAQYAHYMDAGNKLAAKSIEFVSECSIDEILAHYDTEGWTDEQKQQALIISPGRVEKEIAQKKKVSELMELGYSEVFSAYIAKDGDKYERACAIASQSGVSMDVKILAIFCDEEVCKALGKEIKIVKSK